MNIGEIRQYRNKVVLTFNERGDDFTLNVPHKNKWLAIINFLRKRGFKIGVNQSYKKHYDVLSKYHKIGSKKDVSCLLEIGARFIEIEFGNTKNLWTGIAQSFWDDKSDDRYTQLSYLEELAVKLEIKKTLDFCKKYNLLKVIEDKNLSPEQYILKSLKNNTHIHGKVNCLNDIKKSITKDSYDFKRNSNDKNGVKIICGDLKYYYDYRTKRLMCGYAWHNINNMWWILRNGEKRNISSFELFDYNSDLPKRKILPKEASIKKLNNILSILEKDQEYEKCINLRNYIKKIA